MKTFLDSFVAIVEDDVTTLIPRFMFLDHMKETLKEAERMGSVIFPMKGNEHFDEVKKTLKTRIKVLKKIVSEGESYKNV